VDFPLVGMLDKSVLLAALLTAAVRPVLKTAPAFGFDAPVQGSGEDTAGKVHCGNGQRATREDSAPLQRGGGSESG